MLSPFRFAGIITVIFAVCGPAGGQAIAPAGSGVNIHKVDIYNGLAHTVQYFVTGGSPQLQALVRRIEWAENELSVIEQLQLLKLDTVVNDRRVAAFRTTQLTNPYCPPGFIPLSSAVGNGGDGESSLQRALKVQLAYEATPEAALQLIGFLEHLQTDLDAQLKALPPQEKKAAQVPIDALRPRLAALPRRDVPPPRPQPVVPVAAPQVRFPAQKVPQQPPTPQDAVAFEQMVRQNQERVRQQIAQTQQQMKILAQPGPAAAPDAAGSSCFSADGAPAVYAGARADYANPLGGHPTASTASHALCSSSAAQLGRMAHRPVSWSMCVILPNR